MQKDYYDQMNVSKRFREYFEMQMKFIFRGDFFTNLAFLNLVFIVLYKQIADFYDGFLSDLEQLGD